MIIMTAAGLGEAACSLAMGMPIRLDDVSCKQRMNAAVDLIELPSEDDVEQFGRLSASERVLTLPLSLLLAETATSGIIRYAWPLYCPLVECIMENAMRQMTSIDTSKPEIGPPRPHEHSLTQSIDRFKGLLSGFSSAPWTLQRICEICLSPSKQYSRLHKLTAALEKLLTVTTELPHQSLPLKPLPASLLSHINENPPPMFEASNPRGTPAAQHQPNPQEAASTAFLASLMDVNRHGQNAAMDHIAEDHWPTNMEAVTHHPFPLGHQEWSPHASPFSPSSSAHSPPVATALNLEGQGFHSEFSTSADAIIDPEI